jgi:hypothetical protein
LSHPSDDNTLSENDDDDDDASFHTALEGIQVAMPTLPPPPLGLASNPPLSLQPSSKTALPAPDRELVAKPDGEPAITQLEEMPIAPENYHVLDSWKTRLSAAVAGAASGFLQSFIGAGGPPYMTWLAVSSVDMMVAREAIIATSAVTLPLRAGLLLFGPTSLWDGRRWPAYLLMSSCALAGLAVGNRVSRFVDRALVMKIILVLLFTASSLMISNGNGIVAVIAGVLAMIATAAIVVSTIRANKSI